MSTVTVLPFEAAALVGPCPRLQMGSTEYEPWVDTHLFGYFGFSVMNCYRQECTSGCLRHKLLCSWGRQAHGVDLAFP